MTLKPKKPKGQVAEPEKRARGHVQHQVLDYMRRGLMVGAFLPGQVMSLRKLAAGIGTSPMPVREVLSRLVASNALEETANGSVRVPRLSPDKLQDLFSVREQLEGEAAKRAAKNAKGDLLTELTKINNDLLKAIQERAILDCLAANQQFHFTLYRQSRSDVLMPLIESLWLQFGPTMYLSLLVPSMPWDASSHKVIIESLRAKNPEGVRRAVVEDIRRTGRALLSLSGSQGEALPFSQSLELRFN